MDNSYSVHSSFLYSFNPRLEFLWVSIRKTVLTSVVFPLDWVALFWFLCQFYSIFFLSIKLILLLQTAEWIPSALRAWTLLLSFILVFQLSSSPHHHGFLENRKYKINKLPDNQHLNKNKIKIKNPRKSKKVPKFQSQINILAIIGMFKQDIKSMYIPQTIYIKVKKLFLQFL